MYPHVYGMSITCLICLDDTLYGVQSAPNACCLQDVLWRVGSSFLGPFKPDFMAVTMSSPDLYGPFWVATTLIFVTAGEQHVPARHQGSGNSDKPSYHLGSSSMHSCLSCALTRHALGFKPFVRGLKLVVRPG